MPQLSPTASRARILAPSALSGALLFLIGCGAPGEPVPPSPPVPVAVTDLTARQVGDAVQLIFALPGKTITGDKLSEPPAVEILRGAVKDDGTADNKSFRIVYTIPGATTDNYLAEGRVHFTDSVSPEEIRAHPGEFLAYRVRTRASRKRSSADSNTVTLRVYAVPERIPSVEARVTETAIELTWPAPTRTSAGDPLAGVSGYRIYRGELDPSSADAALKDLAQAKWTSPLVSLATSPTTSYRDSFFDFGKTYVYAVRTIVLVQGNELESGDSVPAVVTPRDIFPPAAPQGLVAAVLPSATQASVEVDLSWSINLETDLAGYRVYRSEEPGTRGQLLTPDLLLTPSYRDTSVLVGHPYWYSVTAVDRAGNESQPSARADTGVAQPSP
jgi:fibronectin type 3 domain-containing protein